MAVTYDSVDLSQINFNLLRHDYTDGMYPGFPIIADWGNDPKAHVAEQVKSSLFKTMIANGLNQMNLYDTDSNVIGEIIIQNYEVEYVTYERVGMFGDEQTSTSGYPEYRNQGLGGDWGVKYIRITRGGDPDFAYDIVTTITINGVTERRHWGSLGAIEVADYYGTLDGSWAQSIVCGQDSPTYTLMTKTTGGVTHQYLEWTNLGPIAYTTPKIDYGFETTLRDATLLADNLSFTEHVIEEDGYVNELLNRFSPRFWTNCVGMYMIPASTGSDRSGIESVMKMLQEFDISDQLVNSWVGTDGKEYVINLRWYFGLNNAAYVKKAVDRVAMQIGPVLPTAVPVVPGEDPAYYYEDVATSEFAVWHTSELFVAPHFDNYLDMLTSYQLYLPYYGFLSLDPNDVVGARLKVYYNINLFTGHCDIIVTTKSNRTNNKEEKTYSVSCVVGEDIPFTTEMYQSMGLILGQRIKEAAGVLSSYAKGDMKGMLDAVGLDSSKVSRSKTDSGTDDVDDASDKTSTLNQVINVANSVLGTTPKPTPTPARSGNFSAETGTLEDLFPYLLVTRPISAAPSNYEEYDGIPSFKTANLGSISGFTKIAAVSPRSMTDAPKYVNEILSLLQAGVYL